MSIPPGSSPPEAPLKRPVEPPGSWVPARKLARRALAPVERFLAVEASSGIVLLASAAIALFWANSPWRASYAALWHTRFGIQLAQLSFERDLHFLINDGVMTIFFFVVGLEIRREMAHGELSELRRAALPLAAAVGGMLVPALIYWGLNRDRVTLDGWGIPMATDIAFAVGVLALLGRRVPPALRILLLALAVIDDVGAILVIAIFYSSHLAPFGFLIAAAGLAGVRVMQALGVRSSWAYVPAGAVVWAGALVAGVHPTLAGVAIGMMTPVHAWFGPKGFLEQADASVAALREHQEDEERHVIPHLDRIDQARREAVSPVEGVQHALHGWVAFGVMPLFALANAGVTLGDASFSDDSLWVLSGVVAGLLLGKPIGILGLSWMAARLGIATLPRGVSFSEIAVVGVVAGIGFTMSIFIAHLAFPVGVHLETAKLAILIASGAAALLGYGLGSLVLSSSSRPGAAATVQEAEASTGS